MQLINCVRYSKRNRCISFHLSEVKFCNTIKKKNFTFFEKDRGSIKSKLNIFSKVFNGRGKVYFNSNIIGMFYEL